MRSKTGDIMGKTSNWRAAAAILVAGSCLVAAHAVQAEEIAMASWGGGVGDTWRQAFAKKFQEDTGIKVTVTDVPNPESQVRIQAKNPKYNAIIASYFEAAKLYKDGLLETFDPKELPEVANTPDIYKLKTKDGRLIGAPAYFTYYGIAINTDAVKPQEMNSWNDLGAKKWKGQIAITQPIYSSTYHLTILSYAKGGNENDISAAVPMFKQHASNAAVVYTSLAQLNQLLMRGEVVAAPYYLARVWGMKRDGVKNVDIVLPKEGALMLPYIVVVPKGSPDRAAVKKWLNYVASPEPQLRTAELSGYFPLNAKAVVPPEQEKVLGMSLANMKARLHQPDWFAIADKQKERVELVEKIIAEK
jgi:putative spermidine/putrescine transport system substrate-binding protein